MNDRHDVLTAERPLIDHRVRLARQRSLAVVLALGATAAAANLLLRPVAAEDSSEFAQVAPDRDAVWLFGLVGAISTPVAYLAVGLASCLLVSARGGMLATVGGMLTGLGAFGYACGFFAFHTLSWYGTADVLSPQGEEFLTYVGDNAGHVFGPQMLGFLLCALGYLTIAGAFWRSRAVPRWLPISIAVTFVLTMLAGTGIAFDVVHAVYMATFVAVAWFAWHAPQERVPATG
ncbi:hypothetical protein [Nocardioides speluncae]|uniref:hypothetical protein n=1 Tax=Nocardioides speluncae TaxID=2670337 RepID=UPI000D68B0A1|nr:hypothetical protein [Nocardioides speluncae]